MSGSGDDDFLTRWSRRKAEAKRAPAQEEPVAPAPATTPAPAREAGDATPDPAPLPSLESLTAESDFAPFMQPEVDEGLKRKALKALFSDPRFNVMDGLDVYIDDYSKPDPLPASWLSKLNQLARLGHYQEPVPEPDPAAAAADPAEGSNDPAEDVGIAARLPSESDTSDEGAREPEI